MNDAEINKAIFQPESPRRAKKIYKFISDNANLITTAGGMGHIATGLDRSKYAIVAKAYDIDISKYESFIDYYEEMMIKEQNRK